MNGGMRGCRGPVNITVDNGCHGELDILCLNGIKREMDFDAKDGEGIEERTWGCGGAMKISSPAPHPPTPTSA